MAEKRYTRPELEKLNKPELQNIATDLKLPISGLTKSQLCDVIWNVIGGAKLKEDIDTMSDEVLPMGDMEGDHKAQGPPSSIFGRGGSISEQIELRRLELEMENVREQRAYEMRKLEMQHELEVLQSRSTGVSQTGNTQFRVDSAVKLMPKLVSETEIDVYLLTFEKIALLNNWPREHWPALLQTQLRGKGLKVFSELSLSECRDYATLKTALLTAYELSSEVYRKRFRGLTKCSNETYSDYAFKLTNICKRWLTSVNAYDDIHALRQVILMEQFSENLSSDLNLWLVDRKLNSVDKLALAADQYVALRKTFVPTDIQAHKQDTMIISAYKSDQRHKYQNNIGSKQVMPFLPSDANQKSPSNKALTRIKTPIKCFYYQKANHTISECRLRKKHEANKDNKTNVLVNENVVNETRNDSITPTTLLIESAADSAAVLEGSLPSCDALSVLPVHPLFVPFCQLASISSSDGNVYQVQYLRDTAALQSLLLESSVPSSAYKNTGEFRVLRGVSNTTIEVPLVEVHLKTDFLDQTVLVGLIKNLPEGVDFLLGNDLWFLVNSQPTEVEYDAVVTRSRSRDSTELQTAEHTIDVDHNNQLARPAPLETSGSIAHYGDLDLTQIQSFADFKALQQVDVGLQAVRNLVECPPFPWGRSFYYIQNDLLMHHAAATKRLPEAEQLVIPMVLRNKILHLAHDIPAAGHLGFNKTQARLWAHVYWPHSWKDTMSYLKSCDRCQRVGKGPKPTPAPLIPLPVISEPFRRIAIDIVGPLPVCPKTNNRFILTIIDMATHYPEAIAIPDHTSQRVAQALVSHFSRFGFPEEILSDQGPDLVSELMQIFLNDFSITQIRASAYHPQTNGSCERFHRTMKNMIRSVVTEYNDAWDECLPWILFAYREIPVETLGFSPFELLFGRDPRGPLTLLKAQWKPSAIDKAKPNVIKFVLDLREKLKKCRDIAADNANQAREKSKVWYDRKALERTYEPGDLVLVCLPSKQHQLQARYCGPYRVVNRVGRVDYLISSLDKRKVQRICHVNMLKKIR